MTIKHLNVCGTGASGGVKVEGGSEGRMGKLVEELVLEYCMPKTR